MKVNLHENFLQSIANAIALYKVKRALPKVIQQLEDDPELKKTMEDIQKSVDKAAEQLKIYCKQHPNSKHCKDQKKDK